MKTFKITKNSQYTQSIQLDKGTYTYSCNVKSDATVLTIAFQNEKGVWTDFEIPILSGMWNKKAKLTFELKERAVNFDLCKYASNESKVYVQAPMLEEGTNASTPKSSDLDDLEEIDNNKSQIKAFNLAFEDLENYIDGAFKDGVIDSAEATTIAQLIKTVGSENDKMLATYDKLFLNSYLEGTAKSSLQQNKITFVGAVNDVITAINAAIADNKITPAERTNVNNKFNSYKTALADFSTAIENANKAIQDKLKGYSDTAQSDADLAKSQAQALTYLKEAIGQDAVMNGALYTLVTMLLKERMDGVVTAGISGKQTGEGGLKNLPAFWAGGTYDQAIGGTAKAIIRHDGTVNFTDAEITGTVNATSGDIGKFSLKDMGLLSQNNRFYLDALNGAIYLLDENGDIKTSIIPHDLPSTPEAFFAGSGGGNLSLTDLQGGYNDGQVKATGSFTIDVSEGKQFSLLIPEIKGSVNTNYTGLAGEIFGSSSTTIYFELMRDNRVHLVLGQAMALSSGELMSESFTIQQRTIQISSSGVYSFRARVETNVFPSKHSASGGASVLNISSAEFIAVVNRSQIGNNGMIIASSTTRYDFMVGDKHIVRRGNYGFRITEDGLQKSNNMNASTPTWQNI